MFFCIPYSLHADDYLQAPPQLYELVQIKQQDDMTIRLSLKHTYLPKVPVDFAGPSYFGGRDDELVLCAGKAGDIHIWDRVSGALLHDVKAQDMGGDLTAIAWNPASESPFMFATGSHDGAVRIWTSTSPQKDPRPELRAMQEESQDRVSTFGSDISRTDSPVPQESQTEAGTPSRERTIIFLDDP